MIIEKAQKLFEMGFLFAFSKYLFQAKKYLTFCGSLWFFLTKRYPKFSKHGFKGGHRVATILSFCPTSKYEII